MEGVTDESQQEEDECEFSSKESMAVYTSEDEDTLPLATEDEEVFKIVVDKIGQNPSVDTLFEREKGEVDKKAENSQKVSREESMSKEQDVLPPTIEGKKDHQVVEDECQKEKD